MPRLIMDDAPSRVPYWRRAWLWFLVAVVFALAAGTFGFFHAGTWLVREDPLKNVSAVVVLTGGLPDRALGAADLYRQTGAKEVWLTRPMQPAAAMQLLDLPYSGEEQYSRMVLIARGVPADGVRILTTPVNNTVDEMVAVRDELRSQPNAIAVVVTSKAHTRRVRAIWKHLAAAGERDRLLIRASPHDSFDPEHWWSNTDSALSVVREYLGLLNVWAGLPLRHSR